MLAVMASGRGKRDEGPVTSPIAFAACSNGEHMPAPESERDRRAQRRFLEHVEALHKRTGMTRRQFAHSACGAATALLTINEVYGCSDGSSARAPTAAGAGRSAVGVGVDDAGFAVTPEMTQDAALACAALS